MVNCPACEKEINEDFGMVTCPHCKAVFMIDYAGKIEYGSHDDDQPQTDDWTGEMDAIDDSTHTSVEEPVDDFDFPEQEESPIAAVAIDEDPIVEDNSLEDEIENDGFLEPEDSFPEANDFAEPQEEEVEEIEQPVGSSFQSDLDSPEEEDSGFEEEEDYQEELPQKLAPDNTPVDVTEFANSEESSLDEGEFLYTIFISRIDSKDLKDDLKYVLMDEKLKLNHHEYLKKIKGGSVTIPDLHPIKAKRIVEQLQFFDLEVRWVQKRVIMEEPAVEEADFEEPEEFDEE